MVEKMFFKLDNKSRKLCSGQALVEFALVLPFLLMLVVLVFEGVMVFRAQMVLIQAAREGAMYASINPPGSARFEESEFNERINKVLEEADMDVGIAMINRASGSGEPGEPIWVEVEYPLQTELSRFRNPTTGEYVVPGGRWNLRYRMTVPVR